MTSSSLLANTSRGIRPEAKLVLEDGSVFTGEACGALGEVFGELASAASCTLASCSSVSVEKLEAFLGVRPPLT